MNQSASQGGGRAQAPPKSSQQRLHLKRMYMSTPAPGRGDAHFALPHVRFHPSARATSRVVGAPARDAHITALEDGRADHARAHGVAHLLGIRVGGGLAQKRAE
eukprot:6089615-Pyramimonas_sp.AAC.1